MIANLPILIYSLAGVVVVLIGINIFLFTKINRLLVGKNAKSLEDSIVKIQDDLKEEQKFKEEMFDYLSHVEKRLKRSVQSVETIRFNPFKGTGSGGNQSFATAILSEEGNGVVISSIYSREHVSIYGKPVRNSVSEFGLTDEEKQALEQAKQKVAHSS